ncbi:MAG: hypothetical protein Kow0099_16830 [Candidatus Abyssubacteria bacterium]
MTKTKIICWDLDDTLGSFRNILSARSGGSFPNPNDSYSLRADIIRTLNRMIAKGCRHVITSSAKLEYTTRVLQAICFDAYFDHIFGRNSVTEGIWGKKYRPASEQFQLDDAQACAQMMVIANMASDEPVDIGIVFVHDDRPLTESALVYDRIVQALWTAGDGDFKKGFASFFERGRTITCLDKDFNFMLVEAKLCDGLTVDMGYKNSACTNGLTIPTILNIRPA